MHEHGSLSPLRPGGKHDPMFMEEYFLRDPLTPAWTAGSAIRGKTCPGAIAAHIPSAEAILIANLDEPRGEMIECLDQNALAGRIDWIRWSITILAKMRQHFLTRSDSCNMARGLC